MSFTTTPPERISSADASFTGDAPERSLFLHVRSYSESLSEAGQATQNGEGVPFGGITTVAGDIILVNVPSGHSQAYNGLWIVQVGEAAAIRHPAFNTTAELQAGCAVKIRGGTDAGKTFRYSSGTLEGNDVEFADVSSPSRISTNDASFTTATADRRPRDGDVVDDEGRLVRDDDGEIVKDDDEHT